MNELQTPVTTKGGPKSFLDLPQEIRERIYRHALISRGFCAWPVDDTRPRDGRPYQIWPAIIRTCRTIYAEATPILYTQNAIGFDHPSNCNVFHHIMDRNYVNMCSSFIIRMRERDRTLWKNYFASQDKIRSLNGDFPNLKRIKIWFRPGNWWSPNTSAETNFERLLENPKLKELCQWLNELTAAEVCFLCSLRIPPQHFEYIKRTKAMMIMVEAQHQIQLHTFDIRGCHVHLQLLSSNAPFNTDVITDENTADLTD